MMSNRVVKAAVLAAMALAGVSPAGARTLPAAKADRATLCSRAALTYASATDEGSPEHERRGKLFHTMLDASDFYDVTGLDDARGNALLEDIRATVNEGDWLATVNDCKQAYALGAAEPMPDLPADARQRTAICAALPVARILGSSGPDISTSTILGTLLRNPASAYYFMSLAALSGGLAEAQDASSDEMGWILKSGAIGHLERKCLDAFPGASDVRPVTLPSDSASAAFACAFHAGFLENLAIDESPRAAALSIKLESIDPSRNATPVASRQRLIAQAFSLGRPLDVLSACEARFG